MVNQGGERSTRRDLHRLTKRQAREMVARLVSLAKALLAELG